MRCPGNELNGLAGLPFRQFDGLIALGATCIRGKRAQRAGMGFEEMVGAIGFEFWARRIFNNIESHGGHPKAVEDSGKQR